MKKATRTLQGLLALLLALTLCGCGGKTPAGTPEPAPSETLTQPPADPAPETPSETPQEEPFVPDYAPGEEVTDSIRADSDLYFGALAAQQGRWLYYGVADGTGGWECSSHTYAIVKLPLGGTAEDRVVLMTINDLHMDFNLACQRCGKDTTTYGTIKDIIGTLGDWIYLTVDEHILRLRTDGRIMESVLCLKPDGQTTHTYLAIRDNMLYYLAAERRPVSASQTEDTWTIRKLDLACGETRDVGAVPVPVTMAGWCGDALILQDFKDLDHCNAYVLGPDDSLTFCEKWSFIYDKDYFGYFSILPGYAGEEMILFGELISHGLDGIYRMSREDLEGFAKQDYYIPKVGETQVGLYSVPIYDLSPFSAFLLPGTEDFSETTVSYGCGVEDASVSRTPLMACSTIPRRIRPSASSTKIKPKTCSGPATAICIMSAPSRPAADILTASTASGWTAPAGRI